MTQSPQSFAQWAADFTRATGLSVTDDAMKIAQAHPAAAMLFVGKDRVPVSADGHPQLLPVSAMPNANGSKIALLGTANGAPLLMCTAHPDSYDGDWANLRELATVAEQSELDIVITAIALARWQQESRHCTACGGVTDLTTAGWASVCTDCETEHFPRTDPAIIVAPADGDRLLLGSNVAWEQQRFSCFAGFVEAGESLEDAAKREVFEEAGVRLTNLRYAGSQAWPYPRSLMLGFHADIDGSTPEPDGEEIVEVRWFTRDEILEILDGPERPGAPTLAGRPSIAHRLIRQWAEGAA